MASPWEGAGQAARTASRARVRPYDATSPKRSAATASLTASQAAACAARILHASGWNQSTIVARWAARFQPRSRLRACASSCENRPQVVWIDVAALAIGQQEGRTPWPGQARCHDLLRSAHRDRPAAAQPVRRWHGTLDRSAPGHLPTDGRARPTSGFRVSAAPKGQDARQPGPAQPLDRPKDSERAPGLVRHRLGAPQGRVRVRETRASPPQGWMPVLDR